MPRASRPRPRSASNPPAAPPVPASRRPSTPPAAIPAPSAPWSIGGESATGGGNPAGRARDAGARRAEAEKGGVVRKW